MKKLILPFVFITFLLISCNAKSSDSSNAAENANDSIANLKSSESNVISLTTEEFKKLIYDYDKNPEGWKSNYSEPCVIDFYADWCRPCKQIAPILEELATEYKGKVKFYKVDTQMEQALAQKLGISSIPLVIFCAPNKQPQGSMGAYPKEEYKKQIEQLLQK